MKKSIALLLVFILFLLSACGVKKGKDSSGVLEYNTPDRGASVLEDDREPVSLESGPLFFNGFRSLGDAPFSLPEGDPDAESLGMGFYKYSNIGTAEYEKFLSDRKNEGFAVVRMKYEDFLFRDDCMVFAEYDSGKQSFLFYWYQESSYAPESGISAKDGSFCNFGGRKSLSSIPIHPIDVTPEGFYEYTGGQVFAVPTYSYDKYKEAGDYSMMFAANEHYSCRIVYVRGDMMLGTSMECIAVDDVDGDGKLEVLLLSYGPTSGVFTFDIVCVAGNAIYDTIYMTEHQNLSFSCMDGKIAVLGDGYSSGTGHIYEVVQEKDEAGTYICLYENGEEINTGLWGIRNSLNLTKITE